MNNTGGDEAHPRNEDDTRGDLCFSRKGKYIQPLRLRENNDKQNLILLIHPCVVPCTLHEYFIVRVIMWGLIFAR
jgi:hypothetical protein